ncbi:LexA family protein [Corynebacterium kalidii]
MSTPVRIVPGDQYPIAVATDAVPAGFPSPAQDYDEPGIDLSAQLIDHPAATFLVRVAGDSMTGRGIDDGDELIVDRSLTARGGDVVVALIDGEFTVKTFDSGPPAVLKPANPDFDDIALSGREDAEIWGVVTTCLHHLRHTPKR